MDELYEILKDNTIKDCFIIEKELEEYKNLLNLFESIKNKDFYLLLIVVSCVVFYTSSKKSDYWKILSEEIKNFDFNKVSDIYLFYVDFLPKIKKDRSKILNKIQKIKDLKPFLDDMYFKQKYYYKNMNLLKDKISSSIDMLFNEKIAIFAVRYYAFGARIKFNQNIAFPEEFSIAKNPILEKIYKIYNKEDGKTFNEFYKELAEKLNIPEYNLGILITEKYEI